MTTLMTLPIIFALRKDKIQKFSLLDKIVSPKVISLVRKIRELGNPLTDKEQIQRLVSYAVNNKAPEIVEELIHLGIDINQTVDYLDSETILAYIVQYPNYHDLFKMLIDAGAQPYCHAEPGETNFFSNVLYRCVTYEEPLNIIYLIEKKFCTAQEALCACYLQNKLHMIQYFMDIFSDEIDTFKAFVLKTPMSRQKFVLTMLEIHQKRMA